jgi:hypothetical protein
MRNTCRVGEVSQAEFALAARGAQVIPGAGPMPGDVALGISSVARTAVRRVHQHSPAIARSYFNGMVARYLLGGGSGAATARSYATSLNQYISWDGGSGAADLDVGFRAPAIIFAPGDGVRALVHVLQPPGGSGQLNARVLLWDELPLDVRSAEMIALPVVERVNSVYGPGILTTVEVWHLARQQQFTVSPTAAQTRRTEVQTLLANL